MVLFWLFGKIAKGGDSKSQNSSGKNSGTLSFTVYDKPKVEWETPNDDGDNSKWGRLVYAFENLTPYQFLKAKYKGAEPTARDKRLVEDLLVEQKFNPGVVNVLISYVLQVNNQQLKKSYVETIAGQWKRLNIQTVEDAMKITEKEYKKLKGSLDKTSKNVSSTKKEVSEPVWFNTKPNKSELSDEESMELDKILEELV